MSDNHHSGNEEDLLSDGNYIRSAGKVITEALRQNCDVLQLANGDVIVTEVRTVIYHHQWDPTKNRMIRIQLDNKTKKPKESGEEFSEGDVLETVEETQFTLEDA